MTATLKTTFRGLAATLLFCASAAWGQVTYDYNGPVYGAEAIAPYSATMNTSGWVSINNTGLPPSTGVNLAPLLANWNISDGVITYTPANSVIFSAFGYTGSSSELTGFAVSIMQPLGPHTNGQRIDSVHIFEGGDVNVRYNGICNAVDSSTGLCISLTGDAESGIFATYDFPGNLWRIRVAPVVSPTITAVPTLGEWGLLLSALLLAGLGAYKTSRRRGSSQIRN
ncbi:MAG: IPTL-CTERM sorting domain-containing protein [Comamonadaceae bacterium]|nr:IPTL-CTERM sorting domain-containing protein [Comamonadaceae bacterium]